MDKIEVAHADLDVPNEKSTPLSIEVTDDIREKVYQLYGRNTDDSSLLHNKDIDYILEQLACLSHEDAFNIIIRSIEYHRDDPNFPVATMQKLKLLAQGRKVAESYEEIDYDVDLRLEAAIIHFHSPYPEVRAVTDPFDDPDAPVETIRSYFLGIAWMAGATTINTFFSPRQPAISLSAQVLQLLLYPCGKFLAKVLPDWGVTIRGVRHSLNPGPWSYKEQMFATILFTVANGPGGTYYIYLVQKLPQYLGNSWVSFGYEIVLALSVQYFGFGFAGVLRRFVIYPARCMWPKVFPTLAMNRALIVPEKKENIHGWTISKYKFFLICSGAMFLYFWIPNFLFQALHAFNWMTWISPQNFNLGMITGFYGGMGFNPLATFDWNVSGTNSLVTPFYSTFQQYLARVLSGLIIIGMYWTNTYWSAYMPINSAETFANDGTLYNVTEVLTDGLLDKEKYQSYGPPFFSGANVFGQGAWYAQYSMTWTYIFIDQWNTVKNAFVGMYRGLRRRGSLQDAEDDSHSRMMSRYKEVPDWCFFAILLISLVLGIVALKVYPTNTPAWSLVAIILMSGVLIIPCALLLATANVGIGFNVLFQLLAGVWFAGNPEAQIIVTAFGQNFDSQTEVYLTNQKMAHYAKLPPRAIFRGQMISVLINCFIFIGFLNWMVGHFLKDSLCTYANPQHFVCQPAVELFASAVEYGAFGVKNMFELYPILPWCFLIGAAVGIFVAVAQKMVTPIRDRITRNMSEANIDRFDAYTGWLSFLKQFNPAVFWAGSLNWTNGNNLSYATNALYFSFIFMYLIKRRYASWFGKYNYILEAGLDVGVAISGIIQTLALDFGSGVSLKWWGNTVSAAGVDFLSYNQKAARLPVPKKGFFGPHPGQYPSKW